MTVKLESASYAAPCLESGPLKHSAKNAVAAADALGVSPWATAVRARAVPFLFDGMEHAFATGEAPAPLLCARLDLLADTCRKAVIERNGAEGLSAPTPNRDAGDLASITGEHYGRLFREFSATSFWDEPVKLLRERLERNFVNEVSWKGQRVLDAGCGGGRYSVAWRLLGAAHVTGLDVSKTGLTDARERVKTAGIEGVEFEPGSVLRLPFTDDVFDVVFSNGVLHHTQDWREGIFELVRVLRPGGLGWLYLIENPGGYFWDIVEVLRVIMRHEDRGAARTALQSVGIPANRIFYMLDHVMVPINVRLTCDEIEDTLREAGAAGLRRLSRGADFDRVEAIHRADPYAVEKYGVGENRYVFSKA